MYFAGNSLPDSIAENQAATETQPSQPWYKQLNASLSEGDANLVTQFLQLERKLFLDNFRFHIFPGQLNLYDRSSTTDGVMVASKRFVERQLKIFNHMLACAANDKVRGFLKLDVRSAAEMGDTVTSWMNSAHWRNVLSPSIVLTS